MEQYRAPQFLRRRPEKMRFEKYEKGDVWDTYRFRGETVAGREPNNLMVEFRVFNVTKKIEVVYRLRKKAVTDPEAVYIAFPFEVEGGKIHLDVPGGTAFAGLCGNYVASRIHDLESLVFRKNLMIDISFSDTAITPVERIEYSDRRNIAFGHERL